MIWQIIKHIVRYICWLVHQKGGLAVIPENYISGYLPLVFGPPKIYSSIRNQSQSEARIGPDFGSEQS